MKSPHDFIVSCKSWFLLIPIRTFLVRFGGISGEFGRAMVRLFEVVEPKLLMARLEKPAMSPKRTKKV